MRRSLALIGKVQSGLDKSWHGGGGWEMGATKGAKEAAAAVAALRTETEAAARSASFGTKEYEALARKAVEVHSGKFATGLDVQFNDLANALEILRKIATLRGEQKSQGGGNLDAEIKSAQEKMDALKTAAPQAEKQIQTLKGTADKVSQATDGWSLQSFVSQLDTAIGRMESLAAATDRVSMPGMATTAATASMIVPNKAYSAFGGLSYLAGGGRGTDIIPALLSPGEMVMSAKSTRQFASQLVAMNAGSKPSSHLAQGGHVTNVGDINVSVEGGGTGRQTARSIALELRRELR